HRAVQPGSARLRQGAGLRGDAARRRGRRRPLRAHARRRQARRLAGEVAVKRWALLLIGILATACELVPYQVPRGSGGASSSGATTSTSTGVGTGGGQAACNRGMGETCNPYGLAISAGSLSDTAYFEMVAQMGAPLYRPDPAAPEMLA